MTRPLRIDIADGWYHVTARGIERRAIFVEDGERKHFLELLGCAAERFRVKIHAYVLMDNHYHLIVQTPDANLSQVIQWINISYSVWFNRRNDRVGPLFQGRFKSIPIENSAWAYEMSLYIHLNPVMRKALGLSKQGRKAESRGYRQPGTEEVKRRLEAIRMYVWSSYRSYAGYIKKEDWLETTELLRRASRDSKKRVARYRADVKNRLSQGVPEPFAERLKERIALGAGGFVDQVKKSAKAGRETAGKRELRRSVAFEDIIKAVECLREKRYDDFMVKRGDWGRPLLLWGARMYCGLTLREIGGAVGGMDYAAVAMAIRRFEKHMKRDKEIRQKVKELSEQMLNVKT